MQRTKKGQMMIGKPRLLAGLMLLCLAVVLGGCGDTETADDGRATVIATTTVIEDLARVIGGEEVRVIGLMKTGEDPHVYEVKPKDATRVRDADLVLMNGLHLEATLKSIVERHADGRVVALAEQDGIDPITGGDALGAAPDPHCWMDVSYYKLYAEKARDALIEVAPEHAELFRQRTADYLEALDALDAWVREQFDTVEPEQRVIVTSHDAFAYFGRAYGIEVHGLVGISTEQAPRPQDIEALKAMIRERGVRALFVETSTEGSLNALVEKVGQETGASVPEAALFSDSLGELGTPGGTYLGMMRHNTATMVAALRGEGE